MAQTQQQKPQGEQVTALTVFRRELATSTIQTRMKALLPRHVDVAHVCAVVIEAVQKTPALLNCNRDSLFRAVLDAAKVGLVPDGILGQAYLVPYAGKVQFIAGYRGLITLAQQSGEIEKIDAREVHQGDEFDYEFGLNERLYHKPNPDGPRLGRESITHVYAVVRYKNGARVFDVMSAPEVDRIRAGSPSKDSPAWKSHYGEMAKKTIIRRIAKYLPLSVQRVTQMEENFEANGEVSHFAESRELDMIETDRTPGEAPQQRPAAGPRQSSRLAGLAEAQGRGATIEGDFTRVDETDARAEPGGEEPPPPEAPPEQQAAEPRRERPSPPAETFGGVMVPRKGRQADFGKWAEIFTDKLGRVPSRPTLDAFVEQNKATIGMIEGIDEELAAQVTGAIDATRARFA